MQCKDGYKLEAEKEGAAVCGASARWHARLPANLQHERPPTGGVILHFFCGRRVGSGRALPHDTSMPSASTPHVNHAPMSSLQCRSPPPRRRPAASCRAAACAARPCRARALCVARGTMEGWGRGSQCRSRRAHAVSVVHGRLFGFGAEQGHCRPGCGGMALHVISCCLRLRARRGGDVRGCLSRHVQVFYPCPHRERIMLTPPVPSPPCSANSRVQPRQRLRWHLRPCTGWQRALPRRVCGRARVRPSSHDLHKYCTLPG